VLFAVEATALMLLDRDQLLRNVTMSNRLARALEELQIEDDVVVVAGDNLFGEDISGFAEYGLEVDAPVLAVHDVGDLNKGMWRRKRSLIPLFSKLDLEPADPKKVDAGRRRGAVQRWESDQGGWQSRRAQRSSRAKK